MEVCVETPIKKMVLNLVALRILLNPWDVRDEESVAVFMPELAMVVARITLPLYSTLIMAIVPKMIGISIGAASMGRLRSMDPMWVSRGVSESSCSTWPVSYTHLDVYKRQLKLLIPNAMFALVPFVLELDVLLLLLLFLLVLVLR